jgi:hypothetical protein
MEVLQIVRIMTPVAVLIGVISLSAGMSLAKPLQNTGGRYNCYCDGGKGDCQTTVQSGTNVSCDKSGSNPCTGSCKLVTFTHGAAGAAAAKAGAATTTKPSAKGGE